LKDNSKKALTSDECCAKPSLNRMLKLPEVNTVCLSCGAHWYGTEGVVKRYTRQEWDAYVNGELPVLRKRISERQNPYGLSVGNKGAKGLRL
jgi:hypothetical protein